MKLIVVNGAVQPRSFAKLAAISYVLGAGTFVVFPLWVAALAEAAFGSDPNHQILWIYVVALPFMFMIVGLMMFLIVLFGLRLLRRWRPTEIVTANESAL